MQTTFIILASAISATVSAAALPADDPAMPTLGGPNWYDWNSASVPSAASTPVAAASADSSSVSASSWSAWTPSVSTPQAVVSTSSYKYENPFTIYTSMTDSLGVITGMPSVVTSQPAVVTSQPAVVTAITSQGVQASSSTLVTSASSSATFQQTRSGTASASIAVQTGGAAVNRIGGFATALVVMAWGFALL